VRVRRLWLTDFRNFVQAELELPPGLTAVVGDNGQGKTNLLESVAYLAQLDSFRGAPTEALVRMGATTAVVRAEVEREERELLIEAELGAGRSRVQVNRQRLARTRDLLGALRVTVFAPDDLEMVKGGPATRRRYLDDLLVAHSPKLDVLRTDLDRILRQRNALLKQMAGRHGANRHGGGEGALSTLDVWDERFASAGAALVSARLDLLARLAPALAIAYAHVAGANADIGATYEQSWEGNLEAALGVARDLDIRRAVTTVGPHRDELGLTIDGRVARTHASQGEQRSLALAMRLAGHDVVATEIGASPVLLLDDVFSELDPTRSAALLAHVPPGQVLLTTAGGLPADAHPDVIVHVRGGVLS
jgi:DNA replication and repair protein RecF